LEDARTTYDERVCQLIERTTKTESAIPDLKKTVDRHATDLNETGKRHDKELNELRVRSVTDINALGQRLEKRINEIDRFVHTTRTIGIIVLSIISPVVAGILIAIITGISRVAGKLLALALK